MPKHLKFSVYQEPRPLDAEVATYVEDMSITDDDYRGHVLVTFSVEGDVTQAELEMAQLIRDSLNERISHA